MYSGTTHWNKPRLICLPYPVLFSYRWSKTINCGHQQVYCSPPDDIRYVWECRATVEWYWQRKAEKFRERREPVPLCPPQIQNGLNRARIRASAIRGRRLTAWDIAQPCQIPYYLPYRPIIIQCNLMLNSHCSWHSILKQAWKDVMRTGVHSFYMP